MYFFYFLVGSASVFSPNIISTPLPAQYNSSNMVSPQQFSRTNLDMSTNQQYQITQRRTHNFDINTPFIYSPKHTGLYLYLSRILRPIWNLNCVQKVTVDPKKTYVSKKSS